MHIRSNQPSNAPEKSKEKMFEEHLAQINRSRMGNAGFNTVKILKGNVGYLDLRGFWQE